MADELFIKAFQRLLASDLIGFVLKPRNDADMNLLFSSVDTTFFGMPSDQRSSCSRQRES